MNDLFPMFSGALLFFAGLCLGWYAARRAPTAPPPSPLERKLKPQESV